MNRTKKIICLLLVAAILMVAAVSISTALLLNKNTDNGSTVQVEESMTPSVHLTKTSFFEDQFKEIDTQQQEKERTFLKV